MSIVRHEYDLDKNFKTLTYDVERQVQQSYPSVLSRRDVDNQWPSRSHTI